jgi:hypothetical protein
MTDPIKAAPDDDDPAEGDWVCCWQCGGEGGEEGDDPLWDLGEWQPCDICEGKGGWVHPAVEQAAREGGG